MCLVGDYLHEKTGIARDCCDGFTREEKIEAFQARYKNHIKDGKLTFDAFLEFYFEQTADIPLTREEVRAFAEHIR